MGTAGFDPGESGKFPAYRQPSSDWKLICLWVLAVLCLSGMLVMMLNR